MKLYRFVEKILVLGLLCLCSWTTVLAQQSGSAASVSRSRAFSVQPLCSLCLCGVALLGIHQPQRHKGHRDCTEKSAIETFCAKP